MLDEYNWIGFIGYLFAFLLFFIIVPLLLFIEIPKNIKYAKRYGLNFNLTGEKDFALKTPFRRFVVYFFAIIVAIYFSQKILFDMILPYWKHLMI